MHKFLLTGLVFLSLLMSSSRPQRQIMNSNEGAQAALSTPVCHCNECVCPGEAGAEADTYTIIFRCGSCGKTLSAKILKHDATHSYTCPGCRHSGQVYISWNKDTPRVTGGR